MNDRERRFCEEYLIDLCASRAARRAGYTPGTARRSASEWINREHPTKPEVRAEIDRMLAERRQRLQESADRVVQELANIAFGDEANEAPDAAPSEPEPGAAPPKRGRSAGPDGVRTQDRLRALELLGKHLGIFAERAPVAQEQPLIVDDIGAESEASDE